MIREMLRAKAFTALQWLLLNISGFIQRLFTHLTPASTSSTNGIQREFESFEDWQSHCVLVDSIRGTDEWTLHDQENYYDWRILKSLRRDLERTRRNSDDRSLAGQLRAQSSRNVGRMLSPALFRKSKVQTKRLVDSYVHELRNCIVHILRPESSLSTQEKRQLFYDLKQHYGRTTLVLQGGAIMSMAHLGVVKALHEQDLLPQIITGTGTGALVTALVGTSEEEELLDKLQTVSIDLRSFENAREARKPTKGLWAGSPVWLTTVLRRGQRFFTSGHMFDIEVLRKCADDNIGDQTFEEAYARTGRILNITIAMSDVVGTPQLLNYITAPHVVISSAVVASAASSKRMYAPVHLLCKDDTGVITQYFAADSSEVKPLRPTSDKYQAPLQRIGELFNVNHFIVSQTRPYIIPFIRLQQWASHYAVLGTAVNVAMHEILYWLECFGRFGWSPIFLQRILVDEVVPNTAPWAKISIIPPLRWGDMFVMFEDTTRKVVEKWKDRGEIGTWPRLCELHMRCDVEFDLQRAYNITR